MSIKRILSIDGGGIKGVFIAKFLAEIEDNKSCHLNDYFDMIIGTSTGAIIAAGLAIGLYAEDILQLYLKNKEKIFNKSSIFPIFKPKYSSKGLKKILDDTFKDIKMGDCKTRLLIPTFNLSTYSTQIFKTPHNKAYMKDYKMKISDILLASTAAPTYFKPHKIHGHGYYLDGGIGANNPSAIAIVEGIAKCYWDKDNIKMLSISCTNEIHKQLESASFCYNNLKDIIDVFFSAECQYSINMCKYLLKQDNYMRIDPIIPRNNTKLDNITRVSMDYLQTLAMDENKKNIVKINQHFLFDKKDEYIPCYK